MANHNKINTSTSNVTVNYFTANCLLKYSVKIHTIRIFNAECNI